MLKYCLGKYEIQEMCDKAVDAFLPTLIFFPDWFVTFKLIKKLDDVLFSNVDITFINPD